MNNPLKVFLILLSIPILFDYSYSQNTEKVYEKAVSSVGLISDMRGLGSGFFVNSNTFVTNRHVSTQLDFSNTFIKLKDGTKIRLIKKLFEVKSNDLAAYETEPVSNHLILAEESGPKIGDKVFAIGNPTSDFNVYKFTFTEGIINNIAHEEITDPEYPISSHIVLHSASLNKGNSGGPLLNSKGELVGINSYYYPKGNNQFIAIHVSELISELKKYSINFNTTSLNNRGSEKPKDSLNNSAVKDLVPKTQKDTATDVSIKTQKDTSQITKIVKTRSDNSVLIIFVLFGFVFIMIVFAISNSTRKQKNLDNKMSVQPVFQPVIENQNIPNRQYINKSKDVNVKSVLYFNGRNYTLNKNEIYIGREADCDVILTDDIFISKKHCKITSTNGFFYLTDLFSKNGTSLNGGKINTAILKDRDVIKVGNSEILFHKYS